MSINVSDPTLLDMIKRTKPDGSIEANIVELLSKRNPILQDAVAREGNLPTGHRFTTRNTLPAVGWRRYNDGIPPSKSTTEQFDETCGMLEGFSFVDCGLALLNGNEAAFRATEDKGFLQALNIEAVRALLYASVQSNPEQPHGIMPRYNTTVASGTPQSTSNQTIDSSLYTGLGKDNADQASVLFVCWGDDTTYLIYPKGQVGGLRSEDLGKQIVDGTPAAVGALAGGTTQGRKYTAWATHWMWNLGLCVQDQRQIVRIANFDQSLFNAASAANKTVAMAGLIDAMIAGYYRLYDPTAGRCVIYVGRFIAEMLHRGAMSKASAQLTLGTYAGQPCTMFLGFPVRVLDAMGAAEAIVV